MVDILHRLGVEDIPAERVVEAISTVAGIRSWWIGTTNGDDTLGGRLSFGDEIEATVVARRPERVSWRVDAGPKEWIGTHITFDITSADGWTIVLFKHEGWAQPNEFMHHCSSKWAVFLVSLKRFLETGTGTPTPNDPAIDNWA